MTSSQLHSKFLILAASLQKKTQTSRSNTSPSHHRFWCAISSVLGTAVIAAPSAQAAQVLYNNGQDSNIVSTTLNQDEWIRVEDAPNGTPTKLTFEDGANVSGISSPSFGDSVQVAGASTVEINGGTFAYPVTAYSNSKLNVYGGTFNRDIWGSSTATINVSGGSVAGDIYLDISSTATITAGIFHSAVVLDGRASRASISGGQFTQTNSLRGFQLDSGSVLTLSGTSFELNGTPIGAGFIIPTTGTLSGTWADGSSLDEISFDRNTFGLGTGTIELKIIPEPSALALSVLSALALLRRKRR